MREIRLSGSEGGVALTPPSLPLSQTGGAASPERGGPLNGEHLQNDPDVLVHELREPDAFEQPGERVAPRPARRVHGEDVGGRVGGVCVHGDGGEGLDWRFLVGGICFHGLFRFRGVPRFSHQRPASRGGAWESLQRAPRSVPPERAGL